ncbi:MAG: NADH-quinone oxidoreductase subunit C [Sulfurovaceae bacterium]|nr:NADH-quinone oxidoreductase subunit C [Sulfurovaceae bacterium]MDD5549471.1 NADH-quinone oxidoreductase subunit C [Sulfurovaceae bacterium]
MRKYTPKDNVQKKSYYTDRFYISPRVPRSEVENPGHFADVVNALKKLIQESYVELNQLIIHIKSTDNIKVLEILKEKCGYTVCSELSAVDYLARDGEFEIFYQMLNMNKASRVRVLTRIKKDEAIESIVPMFKMANFAEREMYDMFGIVANNHPYLKRILMPEDWVGYPLLKTYPLQGDEAASWYEVDKIFGTEYRDVIGPENRDPAKIDRYDTKRFSRVGHEVSFGEDISDGEQEKDIEYSKTFLVDYTTSQKQLDKRK